MTRSYLNKKAEPSDRKIGSIDIFAREVFGLTFVHLRGTKHLQKLIYGGVLYFDAS
jgi:hypothetical protein